MVVRVSGVRNLGIDGFGGPHAVGVLYPTIERGWKAELLVGDRSPVVIDAGSGMPTRAEAARKGQLRLCRDDPLPRDAAGLLAWLDRTTDYQVESGSRPTARP